MKHHPSPIMGTCLIGLIAFAANADGFTPATPPQITSPSAGDSVLTTSPLPIVVNTGDLPDVQTVEILSNGTPVGWAYTPDMFGEWGFPGDASLSVMQADPSWNPPNPVIMDYHPDRISPMIFFDGEFETPTHFVGTYEINSWPNPPTGNVTIDFTREGGKLSVVITGDGTLGTIEHTGGVEQWHNEDFTFLWDPPTAGDHQLTARVTIIDPTTMDEEIFTTNPVSISVNPPAAPDITLLDGNANDLLSGQSQVALPATSLGMQSSPLTITIQNDGNADLHNIEVSVAGANPSDFMITPPTDSQLAPGGTTTFDVVFKPLANGARQAELSIASNDPDENPFLITIAGNATQEPEIAVEGPGGNVLVSEEGKVTMPKTLVSATSGKSRFTIRNVGNVDLLNIGVGITGGDKDDFVLTAPRTTRLPAGAKTTFKVTFKPKTKGVRKAQIVINSNDADENPFVIDIKGNATTAPEIEVRVRRPGGGMLKNKKALHDFGAVPKRSKSRPAKFTIYNRGSAPLKRIQVKVKGSQKRLFLADNPGKSKLDPGKKMTFSVRFAPKKTGNLKAKLYILSNDTDENPFIIKLKGKGKIGAILN